MVRHIYLCENSAEGIFSAIYRAYEEGYPHEHNEVVIDTEGRNMELFCEYHTVVTNFEHEGLRMGRAVMSHLTAPYMQTLFAIERNFTNESHFFIEILRFEELENGTLFGRINPKSEVLPYLADHFADRFAGEQWVIADTVHRTVLLHKANYKTVYLSMDEVDMDELTLTYSEDEKQLQKLWKLFVDTIAIKERVNPKLQRQMLPLRFRKYMKEFSESE